MSTPTCLDRVMTELKAMSPEEFEAELDKHRNGDIGSLWKHKDPKWLTKSEIKKAILHSHGMPE